MKRLAILSVLAGLGVMSNAPFVASNTCISHPVHARYTPKKPVATRDRKNTGLGIAKAKRAARKAKNIRRNKAHH